MIKIRTLPQRLLSLVLLVVVFAAGSFGLAASAAAQDDDSAIAAATAERFLRGMEAHDREAVINSLPPEDRAEFEEEGMWAIISGLRVHDWTVITTTPIGDGRVAVLVVWTAEFDAVVAIEALTAHARAVFAASGMTADEVEAEIEERADSIRDGVEQVGSVLAAERLRVEVAADDDGNWWVADIGPEDPHDGDPRGTADESHEEAEWTVRLFLRAVQAHNDDRILALVDPERRDRFATDGTMVMLQAVTVHTFEVIGCRASPDTGDVSVTVHWSATLDEERYLQLGIDVLGEFLRGQGMSDQQVQQAIEASMDVLPKQAAAMAAEVERPQLLQLVSHDGCWYVAGIMAGEATIEEEGAESAEDAFSRAMAAIIDQNAEALLPLLDPEARDGFREQNFAEAIAAMTVTSAEMVSLEEIDDDRIDVTYRWDVQVDADRMRAWVLALQIRTLRTHGASDADINELMDDIQQAADAAVAEMQASFARGAQTMELVVIDGRYYVLQPWTVEPVDDDEEDD